MQRFRCRDSGDNRAIKRRRAIFDPSKAPALGRLVSSADCSPDIQSELSKNFILRSRKETALNIGYALA